MKHLDSNEVFEIYDSEVKFFTDKEFCNVRSKMTLY